MAKFLTTRKASAAVEDIITRAARLLILISPYVQVPENLLQTLQSADRRGVKITLVYGKKEMNQTEKERLGQLKNLALYYLENLHAKCYFNEEHMVITSLNLFEASEKNREMGVLLSATEDAEVFEEARNEAKVIVDSATKHSLKTADVAARPRQGAGEAPNLVHGYCIRCRIPILLDPEKPYCQDCYEEWAQWGNPQYEDNYCHTCGRNATTTKLKPLCGSCYNKVRQYMNRR